jgi:hypothetical protein
VEVWALWGCGVTPYVRHSTDCTCCDFGHLRFNKGAENSDSQLDKKGFLAMLLKWYIFLSLALEGQVQSIVQPWSSINHNMGKAISAAKRSTQIPVIPRY